MSTRHSHTWRSEVNSVQSVFSFHIYLGSGDQTQIWSLPLCHIAGAPIVELGSHATGAGVCVCVKTEVKVYPNPQNLILRPAGIGLFLSCPGPARPGPRSLTLPTSANPEVAL